MELFRNAVERALNYLSTIGIADILDILIVAYLIYRVIILVRRTNTYNLARGLIVILVALWLSGIFKLTMINYILRRAVEIGAIALLILFQPELRKGLERMGRTFSQGRVASSSEIESVIMQTIIACNDLSASKTGALIIFERKVKLDEVIASGTLINSDVNAELLKNLFFNKAPLHDGAVVIRDGRIAAAGCVLPLTKRTNLSKDLGMRHRAGIGMSEQSDAIVVIVSEETGTISVAIDGTLKRHLDSSTFDKILHNELVLDESVSDKNIWKAIKKLLTVDKTVDNDEQEQKNFEKDN